MNSSCQDGNAINISAHTPAATSIQPEATGFFSVIDSSFPISQFENVTDLSA